MAFQLREAIQRLESRGLRHGKVFAAMGRGLLAAADGRADEAVKLLDQAQANTSRFAGYVRLVRVWADLLKRSPAGARQEVP